MKIIHCDNFDRETESEILVCENITRFYGQEIVNFLNKKYSGDDSPNFFRLVDDNCKLYKFDPIKEG